MIRQIKAMVRGAVRRVVSARLRWLPLSEQQADDWADFIRRWPAIFSDQPFMVKRTLGPGFSMKLGLVDVIERNLLVHGQWDESVARVLMDAVGPGATVVDVGANIGYFSLLAASRVGPAGQVLSIEPTQRNLGRLCEHLWMNQCSQVAVLSVAAGRRTDWASINFPTYNNAGAATLRPMSTVQSQRAMVVALDDVFERHGLVPDFIKIDVEGFELEALRGMERTLQGHGPVVVCELTDAFLREVGQSATELVQFMEGLGYACLSIMDGRHGPVGTLFSAAAGNVPEDQVDVVFRRRDAAVLAG